MGRFGDLSITLHVIDNIYNLAMSTHFVDKEVLHDIGEAVDEFKSEIGDTDAPQLNYFKRKCEECYNQLEFIHRTGKPEMGMTWEMYELSKLHNDLKDRFEEFLNRIE